MRLQEKRVRRGGIVETSVRPVGAERVTLPGGNPKWMNCKSLDDWYELEEPPFIWMRDIQQYHLKRPEEKAQAKPWTSLQVLIYWIQDERDGQKRCLYIGVTKNGLLNRFRKHFESRNFIGDMNHHAPKMIESWKVFIFPFATIERAREYEAEFIRKAKPIFNKQGNPARERY